MQDSIFVNISMQWNWSDVCETGIVPWIIDSNDFAACFQQICFQSPIIILFAITSAHQFGRNYACIVRNKLQMRMLYLRLFAVFSLAVIPCIQIFYYTTHNIFIWPIDVFLCCVYTFTWIIHFVFLLSIRYHGKIDHRGPLIIIVLWLTIFALSLVWLKTSMKYTYWPWALLNVIFNLLYAATLLPNGSATFLHRRNIDDEHQLLLNTSTYIRFQDNIDEMSLGQTYDERNFISKLLFYWVNPLIRKAVAGNLKKVDDLYDLPVTLGILKISERMQLQIRQTSSLFKSLHKCFAKEFYCIGLLRLISDLSGFASPLLLSALLTHNSNDTSLPYLYTLGLFGASIFTSFSSTHFNWRISIIAMKMRIGLVTSIYEKSLEASGLTESRLEILNLMSTDTDRIVNSCISFHSCWSIPFQLFTTLYLLYTQIGAAFIAGVIFAIALIPINRWIATKIGVLSRGLMTAKDARVSVCAETMENAKQIKLLAWESIFIEKIQNLREKELSFLSKRKYLDALCVYFWATTPVLMCLLTFGVSVLMGNPLTASTTFTSFALLNMLIGPLNAFPWVLNGLIEAAVSLKRVQELINLPNFNLSAFYSKQRPTPSSSSSSLNEFVMQRKNANKSIVLSMKDVNFEFGMLRMRNSVDLNNDTILDFKLYIEHLEIRQGDLICLQGPVGCGKSTLLSGILGNLSHKNGTIYLKDYNLGFGYVGQRPWLQRGTIRENIIWGSVYDEQRYSKTLWACALNEDIKILGGDLIGVGEGGRTLSGGQRVRVALARAVYQDKPIYLLDDILSALDGHVANHIIKYCLLGLLKKHTRIIITENQSLLLHANNILNIDGGKVTYCDMTNSSLEEIDDDLGGDTDNEHTLLSLDLIEDDKRSIDSVMCDESKEYGTLSSTVLYTYWTAMSNPIAIVLLLSVILMQATKNLSDVWLAHWVTETSVNNTINNITNNETVHSTNYYLGIYTGIAIINSVITLVRAFLFAYGGVKAAKFIHSTLLNNVFFTKFKFFDITPLGRILNRFSSDTYTIDDSLPFILNILLAQLAGLIGSIIISLYAMPWLFIVIIPMCPIYLSLQNRYRYSSRDIKRLSSNALSPLYAHFTETLQGLTTIRAMRGANRFKRDFLGKLEESIKSQLTASAAQQWLALRLQYLGAVLVGGAGLLSAITSAHAYNPSMVGLAISYALSITSLLAGVLNTLALFEQELIAMERVNNYCQLKPEKNANGSRDPPFAWPSQGVISFENVHIKYRKHLEPSLQNINFATSTFERLGIVGRTGAGKSSLLSALLRVAPLSSGRITIDCVDISTLPLCVLRNRIGIVPQEPFLFSGTIRDNLDPQNLHLDSELWNAINNCLATPLVQQLGGLNGYVKSNGSNLSAGQKQLLCMSRALLKNSKIVCIDEGTANLDSDSEAAMQIVLRDAFKTSTVLLIAHRLNSLQKTDRIIVMQNGQIVEEGAPTKLINTIHSVFSVMLQEQQQ